MRAARSLPQTVFCNVFVKKDVHPVRANFFLIGYFRPKSPHALSVALSTNKKLKPQKSWSRFYCTHNRLAHLPVSSRGLSRLRSKRFSTKALSAFWSSAKWSERTKMSSMQGVVRQLGRFVSQSN